MRKNKISAMFLILVLALTGVGVSYAGFTDSISVYGTVNTGTVNIDWIGAYSGTDVWKVYAIQTGAQYPAGEIIVWSGFLNDPARPTKGSLELAWPGCEAILVSQSYAEVGTGTDYDVVMTYNNLFPCIDFEADFIFHYGGSVPAKIDTATIFSQNQWLIDLWNLHASGSPYGAWVEAYRAYPNDNGGYNINYNEPVDVGYQLHNCNYVYVKLVIHLPQDNALQGLTGTFDGTIGVKQWNEVPGPQ